MTALTRLKGKDLCGKQYGRLRVIAFIESRKIGPRRWDKYWLCQCECGNQKVICQSSLSSGKSNSCGCLHKAALAQRVTTHGASKTRVYSIWKTMRQRCNNPRDHRYPYYGGRGITICERWKQFENFAADMGEPPLGCSIERIDNDGDYCPGNCCWATQAEQIRNRRSYRKLITWNGEKLTFHQLAKRWQCSVPAARERIKRRSHSQVSI
jgi:hypothetical protein